MMLAIKRLLGDKKIVLLGSIVYTLLITTAFLLPTSGLPKVHFIIPIDKLIHVGIHGVLSFAWLLVFHAFYPQNDSKRMMMIVLLCISYGIIIEMFQELLVASRQADGFDIIANTIGTLFGMILFRNIKGRIKT